MLVWLDLETTGLNAAKESILEVAAIITDDEFREVARMQRVVYYPHAAVICEYLDRRRPAPGEPVPDDRYQDASDFLEKDVGVRIRPYVLAMHDKNGLWRDCVKGLALDTVDRELATFVKTHGHTTEEVVDEKTGETKTRAVLPQLAGSTISFDRGFISTYMPRFSDEKVLHYRNCDVSTLNEVARRVWPAVYAGRPNAGRGKENAAHRGLADIEESLNVFRYYLANIGPRPRNTAKWELCWYDDDAQEFTGKFDTLADASKKRDELLSRGFEVHYPQEINAGPAAP